ncbi:MAG: GMC family oxidoreductase N-terminal domain-containing protein, partial [Anaerolineales bacterium]
DLWMNCRPRGIRLPNMIPSISTLLTEREFETLEAISRTLAQPTKVPGVADSVVEAISSAARTSEQADFRQALNFFDIPIANLVLAGSAKRMRNMSFEERERVLQAWSNSQIGLLRKGFQTFKRLVLFLEYSLISEGAERNPHWASIRYPGSVEASAVDKPISIKEISRSTALDADAVVIGSGAGGGVVAAELAAAGQHVIVLEKGGYHNQTDFDGVEYEAMRDLYEKRGILATEDVGIVVLAGSTLGGGTTINWTTSLPTPAHVLHEWETELGVSGADGPEWQASLEAVGARINVNTEYSDQNRQNSLLRAGSEALGYRWRSLARNVSNCGDCGYCGFGCRFGAKQSTLNTYLVDAHENGADIIANCHADRLMISDGRVEGVEATIDGHTLRIHSKRVVVAAGSVHSPALLKKSGLQNPNIGDHLHLHPVPAAFGIFDEPVEAWKGTMQSVACAEFEMANDGYGFVVEVPPVHPGLAALGIPWQDAKSHRELMLKAANMAFFFALVRDRDGGRVDIDDQGNPILNYALSKSDAATVLAGARECVKLLVAAGARTVGGIYNSADPFDTSSEDNLNAFLERIDQQGYRTNDMTLFSAHQMSSCRMGGKASMAAFDPEGESYEVKDLYIADASALPSAPGVNPMISIMGLAHRNAQIIKSRL